MGGLSVKKAGFNNQALRLISGFILLSGLIFSASCRHAVVEFDVPQPASCKQGYLRIQACDIEKAELQKRIDNNTGKRQNFVQKFYLWGIYPKNVSLDASALCTEYGIRKIHQYTTILQGFYSEFSLGIYVPRTTEILCY